MQAIRSYIRGPTERRGLRRTKAAMVAKLNLIIRGWRNYLRMGNSTKSSRTWIDMGANVW
jgi:RNA-directed DNA polymerase